jgi:insertion element IS1 protein InsB
VNQVVLANLNPEHVAVEICLAEELAQRRGLTSELDEMWAYVARKSNPRWLWHAIDHRTGKVLAYVFGRRQDAVFLKLQELLEPFGITKYSTDGWGAYERHIDAEKHQVGKENTQKIESKHINLRTRIKRLVRRTICFSKTERMHDLVIGLFINRYGSAGCSDTESTGLKHLPLFLISPSGVSPYVAINQTNDTRHNAPHRCPARQAQLRDRCPSPWDNAYGSGSLGAD